MTLEGVLAVVERCRAAQRCDIPAAVAVGLPVVLVAAGAAILWQLGGRLLAALIGSYSERIAALETDRDHFRDRSEAHDDRTNGLCRDVVRAACDVLAAERLIDEGRKRSELPGPTP